MDCAKLRSKSALATLLILALTLPVMFSTMRGPVIILTWIKTMVVFTILRRSRHISAVIFALRSCCR
jgi:hypothetical protein